MPFIDSISNRNSPLFQTALEHVVDTARSLRDGGNGPLNAIAHKEVRFRLEQFINNGGIIEMTTNQANGDVMSLDVGGEDATALVHSIAAAASSEFADVMMPSGC